MEALLIPWVLLLLVLIVAVCLIRKWWKVGATIAIVLLLANWHWNVFSLGFNSLDKLKDSDCLRVMTWNISCADTTEIKDVNSLFAVIREQNPDVVFITEYGRDLYPMVDSLLCSSFPYRGSIENWRSWSDFYSRLPIDTCYMVETENNGCVMSHEVSFAGSRVRLYCVHLQSTNLVNNESFYPDSIQDRGSAMHYLDNYKTAAEIRGHQAKQTIDDFDDTPTIVMGDMNDVCGSPCMKVFESAGLRDAWWEGGFGYGATIHKPLAYRIDYVMYSEGFSRFAGSWFDRLTNRWFQKVSGGLKLKGIKKVSSKGLSDHDALVADFEIE